MLFLMCLLNPTDIECLTKGHLTVAYGLMNAICCVTIEGYCWLLSIIHGRYRHITVIIFSLPNCAIT